MIPVFINTILPLFTIILFGYFLKKKEIITKEWEDISNKIIFNIAVPALLIKALSKSSIEEVFSIKILFSVAIPILCIIFLSYLISKFLFRFENSIKATFIHSSFHGNIGYMAYAVGYYALNETNFHYLVIISSFLIIVQNITAVIVLTLFSKKLNFRAMTKLITSTILKNPVIIAVFVGCILSIMKINIPVYFQRLILILSNMALPTALFLIGAGLFFKDVKNLLKEISIVAILKLLILPLTGLIIAKSIGLDEKFILPLLVLLSSPSAVLSYILANQIGGSPKLAAANVSIQSLLCAISYSLIIGYFH